jgi:hypothetical protein
VCSGRCRSRISMGQGFGIRQVEAQQTVRPLMRRCPSAFFKRNYSPVLRLPSCPFQRILRTRREAIFRAFSMMPPLSQALVLGLLCEGQKSEDGDTSSVSRYFIEVCAQKHIPRHISRCPSGGTEMDSSSRRDWVAGRCSFRCELSTRSVR